MSRLIMEFGRIRLSHEFVVASQVSKALASISVHQLEAMLFGGDDGMRALSLSLIPLHISE
jgi:hypothetical protein